MVALKGTKEIGDGINKVIGKLADANDYLLKGAIDQADFNDETKLVKGKEMQERLVELCRRAHEETRRSAARAVDRSLVVRNWLFGWYIVEYEGGGSARRNSTARN